jgi:hypothetical protein
MCWEIACKSTRALIKMPRHDDSPLPFSDENYRLAERATRYKGKPIRRIPPLKVGMIWTAGVNTKQDIDWEIWKLPSSDIG